MSSYELIITACNGSKLSNIQKVPLSDGSRRLLSSITRSSTDQVDSTGMQTASRGPSANKNFITPWIDEFERADELTAPLGVHTLTVLSELSTEELSELQREDPVTSPLLDFLDRDVTPTRDDLRALPLESRNLVPKAFNPCPGWHTRPRTTNTHNLWCLMCCRIGYLKLFTQVLSLHI